MSAAHLALNSACSTCIATRRLQPETRQHSRRRAHHVVQAFWPFTQAKKAPSAAVVKEAKTRLAQLAGRKYGHDLSESQKEDVREVLKELEAIGPGNIRQKELLGSNWKLLYTESTGSSGGKVGPLVGQVDQAITIRLAYHQTLLRRLTHYQSVCCRCSQRISLGSTSTNCS